MIGRDMSVAVASMSGATEDGADGSRSGPGERSRGLFFAGMGVSFAAVLRRIEAWKDPGVNAPGECATHVSARETARSIAAWWPHGGTRTERIMRTEMMMGAAVLVGLAGTAFGQCETVKLHHTNPAANDRFGASVAAAAGVAAIGVPDDDQGQGTNGGSRFVFERTNGVWSWQMYSSDLGTNQFYGRCVATDGQVIATGQGGGAAVNSWVAGKGQIYKKINGQ
jgi:hypothetical protein